MLLIIMRLTAHYYVRMYCNKNAYTRTYNMPNSQKTKLLLSAFLLLLVATPLMASELMPLDTISVKVYYRQGRSNLEPSFSKNNQSLDSFFSRLESIKGGSAFQIQKVSIIGGASPEGSVRINKRLSKERAATILARLEKENFFSGNTFDVTPLGVDWDGLATLVESSEMSHKDEVLKILRETPEFVIRNGKVVDGRQRQLAMLRGGRPWHYMYKHFFPELRAANVLLIIETIEEKAQEQKEVTLQTEIVTPTEQRDTTTIIPEKTVVMPAPTKPASYPFYMALKTNLLYDVALVPNIGAEFYLGKGWSLGGNWMYAWWSKADRHNYWRLYGGEMQLRKYFGSRAAEKPLTGHHLGIYGQLFTYDFELGGKGQIGGKPGGALWDKLNYAGGIEYGYSLPITKSLNLDFSIGAGYLGGEYHIYNPVDEYYLWEETRERHWFGPTKAEISLVWLIGLGNDNNKKGGKQ